MTTSASSDPTDTREVLIDAPPLPERLATLLEGYTFVSIVRSYLAPSQVYRVVRSGFPTLYLKVGADLRPERNRLRWLQGRLNVPKVESYAESCGQGFLLLTEVPGRAADARGWCDGPRGLVQTLARAVRAMHAAPAADCPFDARVDELLKAAERAVRRGLVHQSEFSTGYRHLTPETLLKRALATRPPKGRLVLTHGDCCLPNVIVSDGSVGFVDVGCAGLSDAWRDLALVARSIRRNLGEEWVGEFFASYGQAVDEAKMEFFALLDQLVMTRRR